MTIPGIIIRSFWTALICSWLCGLLAFGVPDYGGLYYNRSSSRHIILSASFPVTYSYSGSPVLFVVPTGVSTIVVTLQGGSGGKTASSQAGYGGKGGIIVAELAVIPGEKLQINVGGQGTSSSGGYNGGGVPLVAGGGGGGGTDIRRSPYGLNDRLLTAGGGGGGYDYFANGGDGGYPIGSNGQQGTMPATRIPAGGGTATSGGTGGLRSSSSCNSPGTFGAGGNACSSLNYGAGGGGGYYGGGGSDSTPGGGGSSFLNTAVGTLISGGVTTSAGHGLALIDLPAPTSQPSTSPTSRPSRQPTCQPSASPSTQPTALPNAQPSSAPSSQPTAQPSNSPTIQPSAYPSSQPTGEPSQPTSSPSTQPTALPSAQPSSRPSSQPTAVPSTQPSTSPSAQPSSMPSSLPSSEPTSQPSSQPSTQPSYFPSAQPSRQPSVIPSAQPSGSPSAQPSNSPTTEPSAQPSSQPTGEPTSQPSSSPSAQPTALPSAQPSSRPSSQPTAVPSTQPSSCPSTQPSSNPSSQPSSEPTSQPSSQPSGEPSRQPSSAPSAQPTSPPTVQPSGVPSAQPTSTPSGDPTAQPSARPSVQPSARPSVAPTGQPSSFPSAQPTVQPSASPTVEPSVQPTSTPTCEPSGQPSVQPSAEPSSQPSAMPSAAPSNIPSGQPTSTPTCEPSAQPSAQPSTEPSSQPSAMPSPTPSTIPSGQPSSAPSAAPTTEPSSIPTLKPSNVFVKLQQPSVFAGGMYRDLVQVYLDDQPLCDLRVAFVFLDASGSSSDMGVVPSAWVVTNTSASLSTQLTVVTDTAGDYHLAVTVSGSSAPDYFVTYLGPDSLVVLGNGAVTAVPNLQSATFSSDGNSVTLAFDSPTNKAGYGNRFPCEQLLLFNGSSNAGCRWSDVSTIVFNPRYLDGIEDSAVKVGSTVTLIGGKVTAACAKPNSCSAATTAMETTTIKIAPPAEPTDPTVVLTMPARVSSCNSLLIDVSNSMVSAGRPWSRIEFTVQATTGTAEAANKLHAFLKSNFSVSPPTHVPPYVLTGGTTYSIQVKLCNFLGACGTDIQAVGVLAGDLLQPIVYIAGLASRNVKASSPLSIVSSAFTQTCAGVKSYRDLEVSWTVSSPTDGRVIRTPSLDPAVFRLDPFTLLAGAQYTVTLNVRSLISSLSSSASIVVTVVPGNVVAKIAGGSVRVLIRGEGTIVDASQSYDEDKSRITGAASAGLSFHWTCVQTKPTLRFTCPVQLSSGVRQNLLNVTTTAVTANATALITVTVSDAIRSSSAQVEMVVTSAPLPQLKIESALSSLVNINTDRKLVLLGSARLQSTGCTALWSVDDSSVNIAKLALTPVSVNLQPEPRFIPVNLVLPVGSLPQRSALVFTLSCGGSSNSLTVSTNGAPLPGVFLLTPPSGQELSTVFHFSAAQWEDSDIPLTYEFGFQSAATSLVVGSRSELSFVASTLPAGGESNNFLLNCSLSVFDNIGTAFSSFKTVKVTALNQSMLSIKAHEMIAADAGSIDSIKNIISVASAALNSVNCSAALNCSSLNRSPCRKTSGECGTCLEGYLGDAGDRSTVCIPAQAVTAVEATSCNTQADCLSWQVCDTAAQVCHAPMKPCPRNCSEHGSCLFFNRVSGAAQQECRLSNIDCDAVCSCEDGFSGATCEISTENLQFRREIRSNLISSLLNLTAIENANEQSVASWSVSLYSLSLNPYEVSVNDTECVLEVVNTTLRSQKSLSLDPSTDLQVVLQAVDNVFVMRNNQGGNRTAVDTVQMVDQFARLVSASMTLGQNATTFLYDNFRITSQVSAVSPSVDPAVSKVSVTSTQSAFEKLTGAQATTAVLTGKNSQRPTGSTSAITTNVISVFPRAYTPDTKRFVSNPLYLQVAVQDGGQSAAEVLSSIEFTFPFNEPQEQFVTYSSNITYTCRTTAENFTFVCPDSGEVLHRNCSAGAGEYTTYCPVPAPTCAQLDLSSSDITIADSCRVVSYNATYVTCACTLSSGSSSTRRLSTSDEQSILDDTGVTNMLATATFIVVEFADTFNAADRFNDPSKVILVIIMFATLWGAGLLMLAVCFGRRHMAVLKENKMLSRQIVGALLNVESTSPMEDVRARLLNYIENVFPSVYAGDKNSFYRIVGELRIHHRYLTLFTLAEGQKNFVSKILIIFQVLTMETMQMFLLAVLYDLQCPDDDGTCDSNFTEKDCLSRKSILDSTQTYCEWSTNASTGTPGCAYQDPSFTVTVFIYILILTSVFTAIINTPLDYFFKICAAPLITDVLEAQNVNKTDNTHAVSSAVRTGLRRLSVQTNQAVQAVGRRGSAMVASTQQYVQKKLWYTNLHLTAKEKAADNIIADRAISEDLREVHKQATTGLSSLVRHSETLQSQHQRHTLRLKLKAENRRNQLHGDVDGAPELSLRPADSTASTTTSVASFTASSKGQHISPPSAIHTMGAVALRRLALKVQDEVLCQRLLLPKGSEHLTTFDAQWGVATVSPDLHYVTEEALQAISEDIHTSEVESAELKERMPYYTLHHGGLAILNLFLLDLLGRKTVAAKIFKNKFEEDFEETRAVSQVFKAFAALLLVACNAFFIYYTLLKALQKGKTWQYQFLQGCVAQLIVEIFLNETLECIWLNYAVPTLVRNEVKRVHALLKKVVEDLTSGAGKVREKTILFLDAPSYLFSSTKVAKAHPALLESLVVLNFHSHLPGELARTWPHYKKYAAEHLKDEMIVDNDAATVGPVGFSLTNNFLFRALLAVSATAMLTLQWLGTLSFNTQRVIIRVVQPTVLSGLSLLWMFASTNPFILFIAVGATGFLVVAFVSREWYLYRKELRDKARIAPDLLHEDLVDKDKADSSDNDSSSESSTGALNRSPRIAKRKNMKQQGKAHKNRPVSSDSDSESKNSEKSEESADRDGNQSQVSPINGVQHRHNGSKGSKRHHPESHHRSLHSSRRPALPSDSDVDSADEHPPSSTSSKSQSSSSVFKTRKPGHNKAKRHPSDPKPAAESTDESVGAKDRIKGSNNLSSRVGNRTRAESAESDGGTERFLRAALIPRSLRKEPPNENGSARKSPTRTRTRAAPLSSSSSEQSDEHYSVSLSSDEGTSSDSTHHHHHHHHNHHQNINQHQQPLDQQEPQYQQEQQQRTRTRTRTDSSLQGTRRRYPWSQSFDAPSPYLSEDEIFF